MIGDSSLKVCGLNGAALEDIYYASDSNLRRFYSG